MAYLTLVDTYGTNTKGRYAILLRETPMTRRKALQFALICNLIRLRSHLLLPLAMSSSSFLRTLKAWCHLSVSGHVNGAPLRGHNAVLSCLQMLGVIETHILWTFLDIAGCPDIWYVQNRKTADKCPRQGHVADMSRTNDTKPERICAQPTLTLTYHNKCFQ